jgi:hypothetical protein
MSPEEKRDWDIFDAEVDANPPTGSLGFRLYMLDAIRFQKQMDEKYRPKRKSRPSNSSAPTNVSNP